MKIFFYTLFVSVSIVACNSRDEKAETVKMNSKDIEISPIVHDSLTGEQMKKVIYIQKTFAEVFPSTLEETVTNFKRDQNPDKEIAIWLNMAAAYEKFVRKYTKIDSIKKQEAFKLILLRSMMPEKEAVKEAELKELSNAEIDAILSNYNPEAIPITTREE